MRSPIVPSFHCSNIGIVGAACYYHFHYLHVIISVCEVNLLPCALIELCLDSIAVSLTLDHTSQQRQQQDQATHLWKSWNVTWQHGVWTKLKILDLKSFSIEIDILLILLLDCFEVDLPKVNFSHFWASFRTKCIRSKIFNIWFCWFHLILNNMFIRI